MTRQPALTPEQSTTPAPEREFGLESLGMIGLSVMNPVAFSALAGMQRWLGNAGVQDMMLQQRSPAELLTDSGLLDRVTPQEAGVALDTLGALPEAERARALEELDDDAFQALLDATPPERRQELGDLESPRLRSERRMELWAAGALAEAEATLDAPEGSLDPCSPHRESVRRATAAERIEEVEDALDRAREVDPEDLDWDQVDDLIHRKDLEARIEDTHGVNLTSTRGDDDERRDWSYDELQDIDETLTKIPSAYVADNPALGEIHRGEEGEEGAVTVNDQQIGTVGAGREVAGGVGRALAEARPDLVQQLIGVSRAWGFGPTPGMTEQDSSKYRFIQLFGDLVQDPEALAREQLDSHDAPADQAMASKQEIEAAIAAARARGQDTTVLEVQLRDAEGTLRESVNRRNNAEAEWDLIDSLFP